ncbi:MAG: AmmeMemoRadiSam system radical SAM enzyme [Desulfovibrionaceae bacterium]
MHQAQLWTALDGGRVHCRLCNHFCVIEQGDRGLCGVRENRGGTLFSLVYGKVAALNMDPVEKKPLYHFLPGTRTFSLGTAGCNFRCAFCQNDSLSQSPRERGPIQGRDVSPRELVEAALRHEAASISYTYSEPTVFFELVHDTAELAVQAGLKNILVSNGFQSPDCLDALAPLIHAANIDLKSFQDAFYRELCGARLRPVLSNLKAIKELGWWLEVTTLVIPGHNDSPGELADIAGFIAQELGADTPWHVSRFHPHHMMLRTPSTPVATLETALAAGHAAGLHHVYIGNVPGHDADNTLCPGCGCLLIRRQGFSLAEYRLDQGRCPDCGEAVAGVWS